MNTRLTNTLFLSNLVAAVLAAAHGLEAKAIPTVSSAAPWVQIAK